MAKTLKVRMTQSWISQPEIQRQTLRGLGLFKMHRVKILNDTPAIRGMIDSIRHLVTVTEYDGPKPPSRRSLKKKKAPDAQV